MYAKTAGNSFSGNYSDLINKPIPWDSTWASIKNKPTRQNPGDMLYWDGAQWIPVSVGNNNEILKLNNAVPTWSSAIQLPTLITTEVTGITGCDVLSAIRGGNVSDGGDPVTERGVCWSTAPNPTIAGNKTSDGNGSGSYISNFTGLSRTTYYIRAYATNSSGTGYGNELNFTIEAWNCGDIFAINHVAAGGVAPVDKSVSYGTVTNIPGETSKCWIISNLGADHQATAVNDATEASAGWYWQFNRKQGYKHDGTTRTPNTTWISSISENTDWTAANDPCALELGTGWRIPTNTEWINVDTTGNWTTWTGPWNSGLKMHAAGYLRTTNGSLLNCGSYGSYWSSTQSSATNGWSLDFVSDDSFMFQNDNAFGNSLRCLRE
jgi:hypothetical protein